MPPDDGRTAVEDLLIEFIEAVVHQVLFLRGLYPPEAFERRALYGVAVRRARHPALAEYVSAAVAGLRGPLAAGALARVTLEVLDARSRAPVERVCVEPTVAAAARAALATPAAVEDAEAALRGFLLRLQYVGALIDGEGAGRGGGSAAAAAAGGGPPSAAAERTWELTAQVVGRGALPRDAWAEEFGAPRGRHGGPAGAEVEGGAAPAGPPAEHPRGAALAITPVRSATLEGAFQLQLWVES